ncbi:MAG: TonB-dependent siderophore receptor [Nostoc sp.]|uniref:TonB-dependent siderophore receptor n=1 Tax=Nostoc sp. TaxID=1180 RepID=UPI002FF7711B
MKPQRRNYFFWQSLLLTTSVVFINKPVPVVALPIIASTISASNQQILSQKTITKSVTPIREIRRLTDFQKLVQSPTPTSQTELISVTGVKVNSTEKGLEVILETGVKSVDAQRLVDRHRLQVTPKTEGKSYIADIHNAQLRLTSGNTFRQQKPVAGITEVSVTNVDANTLRVTVTGETLTPAVELFDSDEGLVFGVSSSEITGQQPTPPSQKPSSSENQPPIELEVIAPPDTGYNLSNATTGTRTNTPRRDIPQSIQVIPRAVIEDQAADFSGEVLRDAGVQRGGLPSRNTDNIVIIRGFSVNGNNFLRNGLRDSVFTGGGTTNLANIERIEVLRGPVSVLYGEGTPSGAINFITKQPLQQPYYVAQFKVGSYSFYEPSFDLSGPLTTDGKVSYRLNAAYRNTDSFVDFLHEERFLVAPVISWQPAKDTRIVFDADYQQVQGISSNEIGLPTIGSVLPNPNGKIPINRYSGEPTDTAKRTIGHIGYDFEHTFNDNWTLHNAFRFGIGRNPYLLSALPIALRPDDRTLTRQYSTSLEIDNNQYNLDTHVDGKFKTGNIQHQLLAGIEFYRFLQFHNQGFSQTIGSLDLFDPEYGQKPGAIIPGTALNRKTRLDNVGFYAQDLIVLTNNLKMLVGGRFDLVENNSKNLINSLVSDYSDSAFSPRVGIVYQPIQPISLYANYSKSFTQVTGTDAQGNLFKPSGGTQYEVGVKADLLNNKLSTILSLYQITYTNLTTPDPNNLLYNIQTGEQRSRGVELSLTGELAPGWNVIGFYGYTDARITSTTDNRYRVGNLLNNVPTNSASLWTTYIIPRGSLRGFGGGLGVNYVDDREGDLQNSFHLPSYVTVDAALYYRRNDVSIGLNFKNLFDLNYYESANSNLRVYPGTPFEVQASLKWQF